MLWLFAATLLRDSALPLVYLRKVESPEIFTFCKFLLYFVAKVYIGLFLLFLGGPLQE